MKRKLIDAIVAAALSAAAIMAGLYAGDVTTKQEAKK